MYPSIWDSDAAPNKVQTAAIDKALAGVIGNMVYIGGPGYAKDEYHPWTPELALGRRTLPIYVGRQSDALSELEGTQEATTEGSTDGSEAAGLLASFGYPKGCAIVIDYEEGATDDKVLAYLTSWALVLEDSGYVPVLYSGADILKWIWGLTGDSIFKGAICAWWIKNGLYNPNLNPHQIAVLPNKVFGKLRGWQYSTAVGVSNVPDEGAWTVDVSVVDSALLSVATKAEPESVPTPEPVPTPTPTPEPVPAPEPVHIPQPLGEGEYIVSVVAPTLLDGANGIAVKRLQGLLAAQGYELAIDGDYGPVTESAVKDFQHHVSIEEDGITGPETLTALMTKG